MTLSVEENAKDESKVGKRPLTASDEDNDLLLYSIVPDTDADSDGDHPKMPTDATDDTKFDIDPRSGQLKVAAELNFETA